MKEKLRKEIIALETRVARLEGYIKEDPKSVLNGIRRAKINSFELVIIRLKRILE